MRVTIGSFQKFSYILITSIFWQLDAMLDQLSGLYSYKFYESCRLPLGSSIFVSATSANSAIK